MSSFECYYEYECGKGCRRKDECDWDEEDDKDGSQGPQGPAGPPGKDGENGKPGEQGPPGQDGSSSSSQIALPWNLEEDNEPNNPQVGDYIYMLDDGTITNRTDAVRPYLFGGNSIGILLDEDSSHVSLEQFYGNYVDQATLDLVDWDDIPVGVVFVPGRRFIGEDPTNHNISLDWIQVPLSNLDIPVEVANELPIDGVMFFTNF